MFWRVAWGPGRTSFHGAAARQGDRSSTTLLQGVTQAANHRPYLLYQCLCSVRRNTTQSFLTPEAAAVSDLHETSRVPSVRPPTPAAEVHREQDVASQQLISHSIKLSGSSPT
jgi:hypothetical protein